MHELGITQSIVRIAEEHAGGRPVKWVSLEIGKLSGVMVDAVRFCFDVCCKGTLLEGCRLEIDEPEGRAECLGCNAELTLTEPFGVCPRCGGVRLRFTAGDELKIKEMEVEDPCV